MSAIFFDTLADETILQIMECFYVDEVRFNGSLNRNIRRLSLCSQRLRRIALPLLYHTVYVGHTKTLNGLLELLIRYPHYACLVKNLVLDGCRSQSNVTGSLAMVGHTDFSMEARARGLPGDFVFYLREKRPWAHSLLLVHLLPELASLHIETGPQQEDQLDVYLAILAKKRRLPPKLQAFTRDPSHMLDIGNIIPLLLLPSMTKICAGFANSAVSLNMSSYLSQDGTSSALYGSSNVERLELRYSTLWGEGVSELLRLPRALKYFAFEVGPNADWVEEDDLQRFKRALDYVSHSLELLDMQWLEGQYVEDALIVWSFRDFSSLKILYINSSLLYGLEPSSVIPSVSESLPNTLEVLAMRPPYFDSWTEDGYLDLWRELLIRKSRSSLPRLRLIANLHCFELLQPLLDMLPAGYIELWKLKTGILENYSGTLPRQYDRKLLNEVWGITENVVGLLTRAAPQSLTITTTTPMSLNPFDKLADEIIVQIIECFHTEYDGNLNRNVRKLSLCNQRLRRIALPLLYHTIHISHTKTLKDFVKMALELPQYASLIKDLALDGCRSQGSVTGTLPIVGHINFSNEAKLRGLPEDLISCIEQQYPWAYSLFLLHLLQDLEILRVATGPQQDTNFDIYLSTLMNKGCISHKLQVLVRDPSNIFHIGNVLSAFLLPSMTRICVGFAFSGIFISLSQYAPRGVEFSALYGSSNVETIELQYCGLRSEDITHIIRLPRALKRFIYEPGSRLDWAGDRELDGYKLALDHVSESLEHLDFRWGDQEGLEDTLKVWSLHKFSSLKVLCIDSTLLYGFDSSSTTPLISKSLPNSLEVLAMRRPYDYLWTERSDLDMWRDLLTSKSQTFLPRLRLIANLGDFDLLQPLLELARNQMVRIALRKEDLKEWTSQ
ncbi:hypothetical protein CPB86DRAFT_873809 [Serendipita vermifera]|nr:hypothetical protein CPB86DRAFT_873809 [Serendipita vermifera]